MAEALVAKALDDVAEALVAAIDVAEVLVAPMVQLVRFGEGSLQGSVFVPIPQNISIASSSPSSYA